MLRHQRRQSHQQHSLGCLWNPLADHDLMDSSEPSLSSKNYATGQNSYDRIQLLQAFWLLQAGDSSSGIYTEKGTNMTSVYTRTNTKMGQMGEEKVVLPEGKSRCGAVSSGEGSGILRGLGFNMGIVTLTDWHRSNLI